MFFQTSYSKPALYEEIIFDHTKNNILVNELFFSAFVKLALGFFSLV